MQMRNDKQSYTWLRSGYGNVRNIYNNADITNYNGFEHCADVDENWGLRPALHTTEYY